MIGGVNERLQFKLLIGVRRQQRNGDGWQRLHEMGKLHAASRCLLFAHDENIVGTLGPLFLHGHSVTATKEIDFHEVCVAAQKVVSIPLVLIPSDRTATLIGRG